MEDRVCLLITTFNRSNLLKNSLERLLKIDYSPLTEILVVSDGCLDNTKEVVESFKDRLPIKYIFNNNKDWSICSFSRNIGVVNTDCNIIITSEPEIMFIGRDSISRLLQQHYNNPNNIISAGTIYHGGSKSITKRELIDNPINVLSDPSLVSESGNNPNPVNPYGYCKVQNWQATFVALYKKSWIEEVGYWDTEFPDMYGIDDIDICTRIRIKCKVNQIIDKEISVIHQWHPHAPLSIMGNAITRNANYMKNKNFDEHNPNNVLVANKGLKIGEIKI